MGRGPALAQRRSHVTSPSSLLHQQLSPEEPQNRRGWGGAADGADPVPRLRHAGEGLVERPCPSSRGGTQDGKETFLAFLR